MAEFEKYPTEIYLKQPKDERKSENDPATQWFDLMMGEWEQLLHNETMGWKEIAPFFDINQKDISTDGKFDHNKLTDVLFIEAQKRAELQEPAKRYVLDYEPFPEGIGPKKISDAKIELREKMFINRTLYLKELLDELGLDYTLSSNNPTVVDENQHSETTLESTSIFQFYIPNLKKAVFVTNEPEHATIIIHNVFEDEVKLSASKYSRIEVQELDYFNQSITRVIWPGASQPDKAKKLWQEKIKAELLSVSKKSKEREADHSSSNKDIDIEIVDVHPPKGWELVGYYSASKSKDESSGICKLVARSNTWVQNRLAEIITFKPDWRPKMFYHPKLRSFKMYYPPEVVAYLQDEAKKEKFSDGTLMPIGVYVRDNPSQSTGLCGLLQRSPRWVIGSIKNILLSHPEWVGIETRGSRSKGVLRYGPEIIAALHKKKSEEHTVPENWVIISHLAKKLKVNPRLLRKYAMEFFTYGPHVGYFRSDSGKEVECFSPELVKYLEQKIISERLPVAPERWFTIESMEMKSLVGRGPDWMKSRISRIVEAHPDLAGGLYQHPVSRTRGHFYPPEIISEFLKIKAEEE